MTAGQILDKIASGETVIIPTSGILLQTLRILGDKKYKKLSIHVEVKPPNMVLKNEGEVIKK